RSGVVSGCAVDDVRVVVAGLGIAHAAEGRRVETCVAVVAVEQQRALDEIRELRAAADERLIALRVLTFNEQVRSDDAVVVQRFQRLRIGARARALEVIDRVLETIARGLRLNLEVRTDEGVLRGELTGELCFVTLGVRRL